MDRRDQLDDAAAQYRTLANQLQNVQEAITGIEKGSTPSLRVTWVGGNPVSIPSASMLEYLKPELENLQAQVDAYEKAMAPLLALQLVNGG